VDFGTLDAVSSFPKEKKRDRDAFFMRLILAVVGLALLAFALYLWQNVPDAKTTTNFETTWTTVATRPAAKSTPRKPSKTAAGKSAAAAAKSAAAAKKSAARKALHDRACKPPAAAGAKVTCVVKETVNTPAKESRRSETLTGILLGLGGILLLTVAFFSKVQEITLPGAASIKMFPQVPPEAQKKVAAGIATTPNLSNAPTKAELAYVSAFSKLQSQMLEDAKTAVAAGKTPALTSPGDDDIDRATAEAINEVLST
jgi:hypothetical protein